MNFKLYSFNVKCSQKRVNLGTPFSFHNSDPKVIDVFFFLKVSAGLLFSSSPCFFLGCFFGLPSVISCRNAYIEYRCTWCICRYNDCPKFGNSWGGSFCSSQITFFHVTCSQNQVNLGNPFPSSILIQNLPKTPKNVQSAGFHTCFRYGNTVIPMVFALALFMHSKILP